MRPVKSPLTTREWEVLDLICAGDSTREISSKLFLSEDTSTATQRASCESSAFIRRAEAIAAASRLRQPGPA